MTVFEQARKVSRRRSGSARDTSLTRDSVNEKDARMSQKQSSRDVILDAAEKVFATFGFEGASMREIANESGISQALLHYHFQSKDNLYEEIFARRARIINGYRAQLLDELFAGERKPELEDVLEVMFCPASDALGSGTQSEAFTQMVSALVAGGDERSRALMIKHYDPIARRFMEAFMKLETPKLSQEDAAWAYLFAHSARMQIYAHTGRPERLTGKPLSETRLRRVKDNAIRYTAAGIRTLGINGSSVRSSRESAHRA